jgi:hypothetical protein
MKAPFGFKAKSAKGPDFFYGCPSTGVLNLVKMLLPDEMAISDKYDRRQPLACPASPECPVP